MYHTFLNYVKFILTLSKYMITKTTYVIGNRHGRKTFAFVLKKPLYYRITCFTACQLWKKERALEFINRTELEQGNFEESFFGGT